MSTWSDAAPYPGTARGTVLRGGAASVARPARMDAELRTSPFAPSYAVDSRLTDPHLQQVVQDATEAAAAPGGVHRTHQSDGQRLCCAGSECVAPDSPEDAVVVDGGAEVGTQVHPRLPGQHLEVGAAHALVLLVVVLDPAHELVPGLEVGARQAAPGKPGCLR